MNRVNYLPDKCRELRKEYHKVSNTIMMNRVTKLPDKYKELRKEYHKEYHNDELSLQLA